jgi:hypothetical protein
MRSGTTTTAAGPYTPGPSPIHASKAPSTPSRTPIPNRHTMQLKTALTPTESTTSLFLIVPNSPYFSHPKSSSPLVTPQVTFRGTFPVSSAYLSATDQNPSGGF